MSAMIIVCPGLIGNTWETSASSLSVLYGSKLSRTHTHLSKEDKSLQRDISDSVQLLSKTTLHHNLPNPPQNIFNLVCYCDSQLRASQAVPIKSCLEIRAQRTAGYLCYRQSADSK